MVSYHVRGPSKRQFTCAANMAWYIPGHRKAIGHTAYRLRTDSFCSVTLPTCACQILIKYSKWTSIFWAQWEDISSRWVTSSCGESFNRATTIFGLGCNHVSNHHQFDASRNYPFSSIGNIASWRASSRYRAKFCGTPHPSPGHSGCWHSVPRAGSPLLLYPHLHEARHDQTVEVGRLWVSIAQPSTPRQILNWLLL